MFALAEQRRLNRGVEFKRLIRAAAAFRDLYDDKAIAERVRRSRNTVASWWSGAVPEPETTERLAEATGLDPDELHRYLYRGGPPPHLPEPGSRAERAIAEGLRRDREPPLDEEP